MAGTTWNNTDEAARVNRWMLLAGIAAALAMIGVSLALAGDLGDRLTRNSIRLALAWYAAALILMMQLAPTDWRCRTRRGEIARWCWTWGAAVFLVHLAMAFQYFHHWSHADAFEHTREVAGSGEGIFVSYGFTLLWTADAAWWWAAPERYAARSVWIDRVLHAFMLFIVFNGTIVYETGFARWAGTFLFALLAVVWYRTRLRPGWQPT